MLDYIDAFVTQQEMISYGEIVNDFLIEFRLLHHKEIFVQITVMLIISTPLFQQG